MGQFHPEDGCLELIQPAVEAHLLVEVAFSAAVVPQRDETPGQVFPGGEDHAPVAIGVEVFGGKEAEAGQVAQASYLPVFQGGTEGLGGVFHQGQVSGPGQLFQFLHGGWEAEEMNRNNGPGSGRHGVFHLVGIQVEGAGVYVHEHRGGAAVGHGFGGGNEGEGGQDHLMMRPYVQGL